eukprot:scaffold240465_cov30-Tisochrysis_lutea.AAC.1
MNMFRQRGRRPRGEAGGRPRMAGHGHENIRLRVLLGQGVLVTGFIEVGGRCGLTPNPNPHQYCCKTGMWTFDI